MELLLLRFQEGLLAIDGALSNSISAFTRWRRRLDPRRFALNPA